MATLGLNFTRQVGVTQASRLNFNSLCRLDDGSVLGVSSSGAFLLDSGLTDTGSSISAFLEFPMTDFGIPNQKHLRKMLMGFEASGPLQLSLKADDGTFTVVLLEADIDSSRGEGVVVPFVRDVKGRYFTVKISNTAGCSFALNSIDLVLMLLSVKAGRVHHFLPFVSVELPMFSCEATG